MASLHIGNPTYGFKPLDLGNFNNKFREIAWATEISREIS